MSTTGTDEPVITVETARHVLWRYEQRGGARPGSCTEHLMNAIDTADVRHAAILRTALPELSAAMDLARYDDQGLAKLQAIARVALSCKRCTDTDGPFTAGGLCESCARPIPLVGAR